VVTVGPYVLLALLTVATVAIKHSAAGSLRIDPPSALEFQ
jgi:hypothetical protein